MKSRYLIAVLVGVAFAGGFLTRLLWESVSEPHPPESTPGPDSVLIATTGMRPHAAILLCEILERAPTAMRGQLIHFAWMALGEVPYVGMSSEQADRFEHRFSDYSLASLRSTLTERAEYGTPSEQVVVMGVVSFVTNLIRPQVTLFDGETPSMRSLLADRLPDDEAVRAQVEAMEPMREQTMSDINDAYSYFVGACEEELDWRFWAGHKVN